MEQATRVYEVELEFGARGCPICTIDADTNTCDKFTNGHCTVYNYNCPDVEVVSYRKIPQVGDKVRVVADRPVFGWGEATAECVGVVVRFPQHEACEVIVDFANHPGWMGMLSELEVVDE